LKACLLNLYATKDLYVDCDRLYLDGRACNPLTEQAVNSTVTNYEASKKYFEREGRDCRAWWAAPFDYYQWVCSTRALLVLLQNGQSTCLVACFLWDNFARRFYVLGFNGPPKTHAAWVPTLPTL